MAVIKCKVKSYIQPFEKTLALRELANLSGSTPVLAENGNNGEYYFVKTNIGDDFLARRLSYWESVQSKFTTQVLREATVNVVRNSVSPEQIANKLPFNGSAPLPNRRVLRYGSHGIHEYRGKFFPQLVKSLINISKTTENGVIADPMCGSGTTILESVLASQSAIGIDLRECFLSLNSVQEKSISHREHRVHRDF